MRFPTDMKLLWESTGDSTVISACIAGSSVTVLSVLTVITYALGKESGVKDEEVRRQFRYATIDRRKLHNISIRNLLEEVSGFFWNIMTKG